MLRIKCLDEQAVQDIAVVVMLRGDIRQCNIPGAML
jgi:hypothetical protein